MLGNVSVHHTHTHTHERNFANEFSMKQDFQSNVANGVKVYETVSRKNKSVRMQLKVWSEKN